MVKDFVSTWIAGRLLGFFPPTAVRAHARAHPAEFPNSTDKGFALVDLNVHPRRQGRPISAMELIRAEALQDSFRSIWRHYKSEEYSAKRKAKSDD